MKPATPKTARLLLALMICLALALPACAGQTFTPTATAETPTETAQMPSVTVTISPTAGEATENPSQETASATAGASPTASETPLSIATAPPTRTPTITPTITPTFGPSPTPTPLFLVLPGTPLPPVLVPITIDNAARVSGLAMFQQDTVSDLAWSPEGWLLAVAHFDAISLVDARTRQVTATLSAGEELTSIAFSPDGFWLAGGTRARLPKGQEYGEIRLWRAPDWRGLGPLSLDTRPASSVAFTPRGTNFIAAFTEPGYASDSLKFWNTSSWEITRTLELEDALEIAISPRSDILAVIPDRYATRIYSMKDGELALILYTSFTGAVNCIAFSPDGSRLATGHYDGTIRLWDTTTGALLLVITTRGVVDSLAFSPNGQVLASGESFDASVVRLWVASNGLALATLEGHPGAVSFLEFSPDGSMLASGSYDGSVRLWGIRP